jgi:hypothetical protein
MMTSNMMTSNLEYYQQQAAVDNTTLKFQKGKGKKCWLVGTTCLHVFVVAPFSIFVLA